MVWPYGSSPVDFVLQQIGSPSTQWRILVRFLDSDSHLLVQYAPNKNPGNRHELGQHYLTLLIASHKDKHATSTLADCLSSACYCSCLSPRPVPVL